MYAYRNWEVKTQFFTDITSSEGLLLKIDSHQNGIRVYSKVSTQFSFRWISDFTRFYYYTLEYNNRSNSHTVIGSLLTSTNAVALNQSNIINLVEILFNKVKNIIYKVSQIITADLVLELSKELNLQSNILPFNRLDNTINQSLVEGDFNILTNSFIVKNMIKFRKLVKEYLSTSFTSKSLLNMRYSGNVFSLISLSKHATKSLVLFATINQKKYISSVLEKVKLIPVSSKEINSLVLNNYNLFYSTNNISYDKANNIDFIYNKPVPWISSKTTIIRYDSKTYPLLYHLDDQVNLLIFQSSSYLYTGGYGWDIQGKYFINFGFSNNFDHKLTNFPNFDVVL